MKWFQILAVDGVVTVLNLTRRKVCVRCTVQFPDCTEQFNAPIINLALTKRPLYSIYIIIIYYTFNILIYS